MITYGKCKILLYGDLNKEYETGFIRYHQDEENPLQAHVFKANHHGSQEITEHFLQEVNPWVSVISSGDTRDYAHPCGKLLGLLGRYSSASIKEPIVFSTEIARTYHPLNKDELKIMRETSKFLKSKKSKKSRDKEFANVKQIIKKDSYYSKAIDGIIHVRTDGESLVVGRGYGNYKTKRDGETIVRKNYNKYDWEFYPFHL